MLHRVAALIVPPACVVCRDPLPGAELALCAACTRAMPWLPAGCCRRCGLPSHQGRRCPAAGAAFARARAVVSHEGVARDLLHAMKFRGALRLADVAAAHLAARAAPPADAVLVPVPAVVARRRRRGFDVADRIAARLAGRTGAPLERCLRREDEARQVGAGRRERRRAGRLGFAVRRPPPALVMLVDDVHTTGATLDAAARALLAAGAQRVEAVTWARTL